MQTWPLNMRGPGAGLMLLALVACAPVDPVTDPAADPTHVVAVIYGPKDPESLAPVMMAKGPTPGAQGCYAYQISPAVFETVTEQTLISAEVRDRTTGKVTAPARYQTATHQRIARARREFWFPSLCAGALPPDQVQTLQRALKARNLYAGPISGRIDAATQNAIYLYQGQRGLPSATLAYRAAQQMGMVPWLDGK